MITAVKEIGRSWVQLVSGDSFGRGLMFAIFQEDGTLFCVGVAKHIGNSRGKIMGKIPKKPVWDLIRATSSPLKLRKEEAFQVFSHHQGYQLVQGLHIEGLCLCYKNTFHRKW